MIKKSTDIVQTLHQCAEEKACLDETAALQTLTLDDAKRMFHELRVYQVELEMQNEELRRTQRELEISRSRYFDLYDLAPVGYLTLSEQGVIQEANLAAVIMLGDVKKKLLKKPISRFILSEDQDLYYLRHKKLLESNEVQSWEMRLLRRDGSNFWARMQSTPPRNGEYWITLVDISLRKETEEELRKKNELFSLFIKHSPIYAYIKEVTATENRVLLASDNFMEMVGIPGSKMVGKTTVELFPPEFAEKINADDRSVVSFGDVLQREENLNGRSYTSIKFPIVQGDKTLLAGYTIDITERKQAEEALHHAKEAAEAANIAKSDFLATMSHEIRTPLGAMLGNIELLEGSPLTPPQQEYLKDCKSASQMLLQVINDVLDFSKIEAGKLVLVDEIFSVTSMGRQLVRMFSAAAAQKGLDLTALLADDLPEYICADQQRLRQIISNLLSNAIKFTSHGHISLEISRGQPIDVAKSDRGMLKIVVRDSGIGIPPDKLDHVFESFTQVESFTTRRVSGTGLGLPICRRLLDLMGGSISVSSVLREGSAFAVVLPVIPVKAPAPVPSPAALPIPVQVRKILLADDDERGRSVAQKLLKRKGYDVTAVEDGAGILDALEKEHFDIVLTDISMPDMEGTQVARVIRSGERRGIDRHIPIIAMTAHAFSEDRERFIAAGINGYVAKPVNIEGLFRQIEKLCGGK